MNPAPDPRNSDRRCVHPDLRTPSAAISLPVIAAKPQGAAHGAAIRRSRMGRRRAVALLIVQGLLIVHIALWALGRQFGWFGGGRTITPIEPSESMQFSQQGIVNAGLIFFSLALLGTLVFGRWFCGWGCHVVMLQDFCGWIMKKCGVRPRPFRSRLLMLAPFALAVYMFIMPAAHRWVMTPLDAKIAAKLGPDHGFVRAYRDVSAFAGFPLAKTDLPEWRVQAHLTTQDFWKTFATYAVAIPFLLVCGFATVYFLGAKGFCAYGCPYGGFFAPLDKLAPGRILVTDACEHCGHCTAVCTSNVRVHEEVREYGMVVDPGCMKCMDCVSVCPNEALYFGFGAPALFKGKAKNAAPKKHYDFTWPEELVFGLVFLCSFLAWKSAFALVPMLMAVGMAGVITYAAWKTWRLVGDMNVTFHHFQLKLKGGLRPAGAAFGLLTLVALAFTAHAGVVNAAAGVAAIYDARVTIPPTAIFGDDRVQIDGRMADDADRALKWYDFASKWGPRRFGWASDWQTRLDRQRAWLRSARLQFDQAETILRENIRLYGDQQFPIGMLALALRSQGKADQAVALYKETLKNHPDYDSLLEDFAGWSMYEGSPERVTPFLREQLQRRPDHLNTMRTLSKILLQTGEIDEGVALTRRTIEIDPSNAWAYWFLAYGLANQAKPAEALEAVDKALALSPDVIDFVMMKSSLLENLGRGEEAMKWRQRAMELDAQRRKKDAPTQP